MTEAPPAPAKPTTSAVPPVTMPTPPSTPATQSTPEVPKPAARDRFMEKLESLSGTPETPKAPETPKEPQKPATDDPAPKEATQVKPDPDKPSEDGETPESTEPEAKDKGKKKVNPWKLVDEYKAKYAELEKKLADTANPDVAKIQAEQKALTDKYQNAQKRLEELENEIRFVDYSKSTEFQEKYQKPYDKAWKRAVKELDEISVTTQDGEKRRATGEDLLQLVNMPLGQAREIADQAFGKFADDVMQFRKEIRSLYEAQKQAEQEARESGLAREKEKAEVSRREVQETQSFVAQEWQKANQEVLSDESLAPMFSKADGDEDGNTALDKGYSFVDEAFAANPMQPGLTKEQRAEIIRKHVAVRNRAAAFGRERMRREAAEAMVKELKAKLDEINGSVPPNSGAGKQTTEATAPSDPDSRFEQRLLKASERKR